MGSSIGAASSQYEFYSIVISPWGRSRQIPASAASGELPGRGEKLLLRAHAQTAAAAATGVPSVEISRRFLRPTSEPALRGEL